MKKKVYMIGNAHLDPVWIWRWQEGSAETKATIRSALDRMNETPEFIFVCSSVFVYECIEEFDFDMFEEMKKRIKEGRFVIVGGWFIQSDCNLPSGEGFVRQALYGQRYFMEKFGVTAKVGYNVDSFGHNAMLPQLLKKSGMDNYVYMRPCETEMHMDSNLFKWIAPDGSAVTAFRICDFYTYNYKDMEDFKNRLKTVCEDKLDCTDYAMCFYGVGNHGGGPTKHNIELIQQYKAENSECEVVFGHPEEFFDAVSTSDKPIPEYKGDFQHHASGCYSAVSGIKNAIRRCESEIIASEVYSTAANILLNKKYPSKELKAAWRDILFMHFHDSFGGCCVAPVYEDMYAFAGEALSVSQRATNNALQSLSWAIDTSDASKGIPVVVFNPHSWEYNGFVTINKQAGSVYDNEGNLIAVQQVFSPAHNVQRRTDTMFKVSIPAFGYRTYYIKDEESNFESKVSVGDYFLENEFIRVEFEKGTGYISSIYDKKEQKQLLSGKGAIPIVINEDEHDTWSHDKNYFDKRVGEFSNVDIKVIEEGPLRATIKVINRYNNSTLTQKFSLSADSNKLEIDAKVDWYEKNRMLKLAYELDVDNPKAYYEIPYGVIERPCDGEEEPGLKWVAMCGDNSRVALVNNNKYSFSFKDNTMNLTVIRSPIFCDHGGPRYDESEYTDIGSHKFKYSIFPIYTEHFDDVIKAGYEFNELPVNIIENNHCGRLNECFEGINIAGEGVIISALKRSEDECGLVLRAYETRGENTDVTFSGDLLKTPLKAKFEPYSIKTFYLSDDTGAWKEVLLTEYDI